MPLLTYAQVRPWAKAIRASVLTRAMPPWHADPAHGRFANDRSLTPQEIRILTAWIDGGTPEGPWGAAPPPVRFETGWRIGKPDLVVEFPVDYQVPAAGIIPYQSIIVPSGFTEDRWVQAVEVMPGDRSVVHHAVVYAREPGGEFAKNGPINQFFELFKVHRLKLPEKGNTMFSSLAEPEHLEVYAPGADPIVLRPGQARLIRAGSDFIFEMHYTTNGKEARDRTRVGLIFAKQPPTERVRTVRIQNGSAIVIPPGEPAYRMQSQVFVEQDVKVVSFMPHMHLRGRSFEFEAIYPDGSAEVLLRVPRYDFHWQMSYYLEQPKLLPRGTVLVCRATWDNSANNKNNPNPAARVIGGFQSEEEMMAGFVDLGIPPDTPSLLFFRDAPADAAVPRRP